MPAVFDFIAHSCSVISSECIIWGMTREPCPQNVSNASSRLKGLQSQFLTVMERSRPPLQSQTRIVSNGFVKR